MKEEQAGQKKARIPLIGILRHVQEEELLPVLEAFRAAGLEKVEITMNTRQADRLIHAAGREFGGTLQIGAGTVCSLQELDKALHAGATFIVTPVLQEAVIAACVNRNMPIYPGAYTPTEIYKAWELGATMVKVFPAGGLGPAYIRDVKASLDSIKLLPVGGISLQNIDEFVAAGADGFGIGSTLFDRALIRERNWAALQKHFEVFARKMSP